MTCINFNEASLGQVNCHRVQRVLTYRVQGTAAIDISGEMTIADREVRLLGLSKRSWRRGSLVV